MVILGTAFYQITSFFGAHVRNTNGLAKRIEGLANIEDSNIAPLIKVLHEHQKLFNDDPQECKVVQHDIQLLPATRPIRQPFYCFSPYKKEVMRTELQYLLDHGLASPWSGSIAPIKIHTKAIQHYPQPTTRKQLLLFLGLASYYRRFVKNFSTVATPLINLTSPKQRYHWTIQQTVAFEQLKSLLCPDPILASPGITTPFIINVDASGTGIGGVLMQQ
ncbi:uncharacterized protein [Procambarus clarkii]|uniref:uncharacterized protein n=1 Tax=Procambarus clarkii TaxID=6728 RepID=UPI0037428C29